MGAVQSVAVVGPNGGCPGGGDGCPAASAYRGGYCNGGGPKVTLLDALAALPGVNATFTPGADMLNASDTSGIPAALAAAAAAQVVVAVVGDTASGYGKGTCAESLDADTLDLPGSQLALLTDHSFWSGYFTSRPALKAYVRESSALFHSARQLQALSGLPLPADKGRSNPLFALERAMAIAQHHDAVSGTSKQAVADDYALRLSAGRTAAEALVGSALSALTRSDPAATAWARCELLNATLCPALEAGLATVVAVWNQRSSAPPPGYNGSSPATVNLLLPVGLPPGVASWAVSDAHGAPLPAQLLPLTPADTALRTQYYGAPLDTPINWLALQVPVPLLGFVTLFLQPVAAAGAAPATAATPRTPVAPGSGDVTLANGQLALVFDSATGLLKEHQDLQRGGAATPLAQAFLYYNSSRGESGGDDAGQASGAYIFRPNGTSAYPLQPPGTPVALTVARGSVVSEVTQVHAGWASQTVRLWAGARSAVFEYTVGPIPGADGAVPAGLGTEVVTRYSTPLRSNRTWYSDSNGRDSIVRVRDYRASWAYNATVEPVAGNYVPVNAFQWLSDSSTGQVLSVAVSHSQGGSSMQDGALEFMVHRRLSADDGRGVGEALNETGVNGRGLIVRACHLLSLEPTPAAAAHARRSDLAELMWRPLTRFTGLGGAASPAAWRASHATSGTALAAPLPPALHLLTLDVQGPGSVLVRVSHSYDRGEGGAGEGGDAALDLSSVLAPPRALSGCVELTLTGNQRLDGVQSWSYNVTGGPVVTLPVVPPAPAGAAQSITLRPMDIRTFMCTLS